MKKVVLKNFAIFTVQLQTWNLFSETEIFKNTYSEEHLLMSASDFLKRLQNTSEQLLLYWLFQSDNLVTSYEQISY